MSDIGKTFAGFLVPLSTAELGMIRLISLTHVSSTARTALDEFQTRYTDASTKPIILPPVRNCTEQRASPVSYNQALFAFAALENSYLRCSLKPHGGN